MGARASWRCSSRGCWPSRRAAAAQSRWWPIAVDRLAARVGAGAVERGAGEAAAAAERAAIAEQLRRLREPAPDTRALHRAFSFIGPEDAALAVRLGLPPADRVGDIK